MGWTSISTQMSLSRGPARQIQPGTYRTHYSVWAKTCRMKMYCLKSSFHHCECIDTSSFVLNTVQSKTQIVNVFFNTVWFTVHKQSFIYLYTVIWLPFSPLKHKSTLGDGSSCISIYIHFPPTYSIYLMDQGNYSSNKMGYFIHN